MAIRDTSRKPYIEDNDDSIKIGIDLPIRRGDPDGTDGYFASTKTTIEAVKNNIRNLLNTYEGERLMQPRFGVNLKKHLFNQITEENVLALQNDIMDKLEFWLPFVQVNDIQLFTQNNSVSIKIIFNITQDPNTLASVNLFVPDVDVDNLVSVGGGY